MMGYVNNEVNYAKWLNGKDIIIFGAGNAGSQLKKKFDKYGYHVIGFCDNDLDKKGKNICGSPVIGNVENCKGLIDDNTIFVISAGYQEEKQSELLNKKIQYVVGEKIIFYTQDSYYDEDYFLWEEPISKINARFDAARMQPYIKQDDTVLEIGSAAGHLLNNLNAREKLGVEINDVARQVSKSNGIDAVKYLSDIEDEFADVVVSSSALEHIEHPLALLREMKNKMKDNGKAIFIVPYECGGGEYKANDRNQHLYTWNCQCLGNLFTRAGFLVRQIQDYYEQWPFGYEEILRTDGEAAFKVFSRLYGKLVGMKYIFVVAEK